MKKQIFYFTGTGNCLSIAGKLNGLLKDYSLHSIVTDFKLSEDNVERQIIIVSPVYMFNIPYIVRKFIKALNGFGHCSLIFAGGGECGKCFSESKKLFKEKSISLNSQFNIPMPSNYAPYGATEEIKQKEMFSDAQARMNEICQIIEDQTSFTDDRGTSWFENYIHPGVLYSIGYKYLPFLAKGFNVDSNCDGCGICAKVCPVDNIEMNDKPSWLLKCEQCYACLQWCPQEAIQFKNKTSEIKRYHNPEIKLNDIIT